MKGIISKVFRFFKKPLNLVVFIVLLGVVLYFALKGNGNNGLNLVKIERGTIVSEVLVTGNIVSPESVDLSFSSPGKIKRVYVKEGDKVKRGDILVAQDTSVLEAELERAKAALKNAEANYLALKKGATYEEIALAESQVKSAEVNLQSAVSATISAIKDAYAKVDEVLYVYIDTFFRDSKNNPRLIFTTTNAQLQINVESERINSGNYLRGWENMNLGLNEENIKNSLMEAKRITVYLQNFINDLSTALNYFGAFKSGTTGSVDSLKTNLANARSKIAAVVSSLDNAQNTIESAYASLEIAKNQLALKKAPPKEETLQASYALVQQSLSNVKTIEAQINQAILTSPLDGKIVGVFVKEGEISALGQKVVSVVGDKSLEIESYVSENDVAKISVGNPTAIKFDAFPGEEFKGKVYFVNSAPTNVNGINQYKIKVVFDKMDERFKSGMTANLVIEAMRKENVLIVPQYAVLREKDGDFVFRVSSQDKKEEKVKVVLGMQDSEGNAEIISGLNEGDEVLNIGLK